MRDFQDYQQNPRPAPEGGRRTIAVCPELFGRICQFFPWSMHLEAGKEPGESRDKIQETIAVEATVIRNNGKELVLGVGAIGLVLFLSLPGRAQETGESLFKAKCAMCHGPDGAGKTTMGQSLKIPDLHSPEVQKLSDADLTQIVTKGKNKMPAYEEKLSKEQITQLVGFIRDLAKKH
jgi:mono/diheme cytochrome c family protein